MVALQIITLYRATPLVDLSCDNYVQFLLCSESCGGPPHRHRAGRTPEAAGRWARAGRAGGARRVGLVRQPGCVHTLRLPRLRRRRREASVIADSRGRETQRRRHAPRLRAREPSSRAGLSRPPARQPPLSRDSRLGVCGCSGTRAAGRARLL